MNLRDAKSQSKKDISKSFADLRLKMGEKKKTDELDRESQLSDLSGEEWTELQRYQQEKFEEEQRLQKQ